MTVTDIRKDPQSRTMTLEAEFHASPERVWQLWADPRQLERYFESLHVEDLALACACAQGSEPAWEHFIREHRPVHRTAPGTVHGTLT